MTLRRSLTTAALIAAAAFSTTGCVSNASLDDMTEINRHLEERVVDLEAQLGRLQTTIAQKNETIGMLRGQGNANDTMLQRLAEEEEIRDNLQAQLEQLQTEYAQLADEINKPVVITQVLPPEISDALAELADQNPGLMSFDEVRGMIRLRSDLTFGLGSAQVNDSAQAAIARLARVLNDGRAQGFDILVIGHTDNVPVTSTTGRQRHVDNRGLSSNRGDAVARVLETTGIAAARITSGGRGDTQPIAQNGERGNQTNRRVEIFITRAGANTGATGAATYSLETENTTARPGVIEGQPDRRNDDVFK